MKKITFIGLFIAMFFAMSLMVKGETAQSLSFTNNDRTNLVLEADNKKIKLTKIPRSEDFKYMGIHITDKDDELIIEEWYDRKEGVELDVSKLKNGTYYFSLHRNAVEYDRYYSYVFRLPLIINDKEAVFDLSDRLAENNRIRASFRTDKEALEFYLKPDYYAQSDADEIIELAKRLTRGKRNDYDKALAIYDWVCKNIHYDFDVFEQKGTVRHDRAVDVLEYKHAVCTGYSFLTVALLRAADIPAKMVIGNTIYDEPGYGHAWVEAYVNKKWIFIDPTEGSNNNYREGRNRSRGYLSHQFFDATNEAIGLTYIYSDEDEELVALFEPEYDFKNMIDFNNWKDIFEMLESMDFDSEDFDFEQWRELFDLIAS